MHDVARLTHSGQTVPEPKGARVLRRGTVLRRGATGAWIVLSAVACNAFDAPGGTESGKTIRVVPTDDRPVVSAEVTPPPVSGGNLFRLQATGTYLLTDPARDRVMLIDRNAVQGNTAIELAAGSRPERAAIDARGIAHVVLRGKSSLVAIDPNTQRVVAEHKICSAPRGITYDAQGDRLLVACAEGQLLAHTVSPADYRTVESYPIASDARDVVAQQDRIYVSRFRSAEVLTFTRTGEPVAVFRSPVVRTGTERLLAPAVAWRMIEDPQGDGIVMLHQRAVAEPIAIDPAPPPSDEDGDSDQGLFDSSSSPYGGSVGGPLQTCTTIVQTAITRVNAEGVVSTSPSLDGSVLNVDIALDSSVDTRGGTLRYTLASAGMKDVETPTATLEVVGGSGSSGAAAIPGAFDSFNENVGLVSMVTVSPEQTEPMFVGCQVAANGNMDQPTTSVLIDSDVALYVQPESGTLRQAEAFGVGERQATELGGRQILDTGHEIFHRDTGSGIACASCHPDGTDDGRVWEFESIGLRRTQHLAVNIKETAPFHWDGSLPTLNGLMDEVFVERMGGVFESPARLSSLENWISSQPHEALLAKDAEAAERGKELFESADVGCAKCHSGGATTDNKAYDVGTRPDGAKLQVPTLANLVLHPPYLHNGCAKTLLERFNPECGGGDAHGHTSQLDGSQLDDLVAYLTTL